MAEIPEAELVTVDIGCPQSPRVEDPEAVDSYDELAKEDPPKRGRGRPRGSKNVPKPPPASPSVPKPPEPASPSETESPPPIKPRTRAPRPRVRSTPEDSPRPKRTKPVRLEPEPRSLISIVAEAAQHHGAREQERRRAFYDSFLPM